ncbi:F-box domain protein [Aspergillus fischeri NRRL 181]|uniref:F-box domain protein n=1 Tax=Neosartorya fischeri (strain ATCC 1020 / DSM 3700 / CBS 544.65 / FGSC A1164 / JCM 1740 / NRRL 181 / WB 181) TaxID=331117 RepID=A1DJR8_NEOFI|nr:F-box domain protein [Aspergillus fischeri NRRL 181]EAW16957.1 F-box domain protein [Aspergillus fischeri NRRL 181]KAG2019117.1 hypothetical protein GB937_005408 [Aspergillus fischeri]
MVHITALPSELLTLIVSYVDSSSWKNLRQTCRLLSYVTAQLLFETLKLYPTQDSYEIMDEILTGSILEDAVKKVYINTREHPYESDDEEEAYFPGEFENRIPRLKTWSKVQNVVLQFDKRCGLSRHHWITKPPQTVAFRKKALSVFFEWLASFEVPLQALGIQHLQDINIKDDELSDRITKVLRNLRALRLSIVSEHNTATTEDPQELWNQDRFSLFPESRSFFTKLPSVWLKPTTSSLEHLTLFCDTWFGFRPKLELSKVHFPHLKSLVLGNFTFFRDSQLEWILSHGATLSELSLDDCMILYDLCLFENKLGEYSFNEDEMELRLEDDGEAGHYRSYNKRWHHYFDAFRTRLPRLRQFRIGTSDWTHGVPFEAESEMRIGLLDERYGVFYDGWVPTPYVDVSYWPEPWERGPPKCNKEDRRSLRLLFDHIGQEVEESWTLHGIRVKNLIEVRS